MPIPNAERRYQVTTMLFAVGAWLLITSGAQLAAAQQPAQADPDPSIAALTATVSRGSTVTISWTGSNATRFDVFAAAGTTPATSDTLLTAVAAERREVVVPIPASHQQVIRVCARGAVRGVDDCMQRELTNVVLRGDDYDPYTLGGWAPEEPVEGTLRATIAAADSGSVIGFASDVSHVDLYGVSAFYYNPPGERAIEPGEGWQEAHLVVDRDLVISGRPDAPVALSARSACVGCPAAEAETYRSRVVRVLEGVSAELEHLALRGGGFVYEGGGVLNDGTLTLTSVLISDNRAWYEGGGIHNGSTGVLTLVDTVVRDNRAVTLDEEMGARFAIRGHADATITVADGGYGGGLFNAVGGTVIASGSVIERNEAKVSGGGAYNLGSMTLEHCVVQDNVADHTSYAPGAFSSLGGGVYNAGELVVRETEVLQNRTPNAGGGLFTDVGSVTTLQYVHFGENTAEFGAGIRREHGPGEEPDFVSEGVSFGPGDTESTRLVNSE